MTGQRIDKWLWFARMVKTRSLAQAIVSQGQVRVNKARVVKPSHDVGPGDILTLAVHEKVRVIRVLAIGTRRGPASEAQTLFEDMSASEMTPVSRIRSSPLPVAPSKRTSDSEGH